MALSNLSEATSSLQSKGADLKFRKNSILNQLANAPTSLWRATGFPAPGALFTGNVGTVHTNTTVGAIELPLTTTTPQDFYLASLEYQNSNIGNSTVEIHDRILAVSGLSGIDTAFQSVNLDVREVVGLMPGSPRLRGGDFSDLNFWLECYTNLGTSNATLTYNFSGFDQNNTFVGGTSNPIPVANLAAGRMINLAPFIPPSLQGCYIAHLQGVTLNVSTAAVGNFGVTLTRKKGVISNILSGQREKSDWQAQGLDRIEKDSCLQLICIPSSTATGAVTVNARLAVG